MNGWTHKNKATKFQSKICHVLHPHVPAVPLDIHLTCSLLSPPFAVTGFVPFCFFFAGVSASGPKRSVVD